MATPDGKIWFTEYTTNKIAYVSTDGTGLTECLIPTANSGPEELTVDGAGNIYGADCQDAFVFRVSSRRALTIVAGSGTQGFSGNGGLALKAELACPSGVALDAKGNLFVADHGNDEERGQQKHNDRYAVLQDGKDLLVLRIRRLELAGFAVEHR